MIMKVIGLAVLGFVVVKVGSEVGPEVGVDRTDFRNVAVDLLDESHVLHHVVWNSRLVILVHLLNKRSVPIQNRLDLPEILAEVLPQLGVTILVLSVGDDNGGCGGFGSGSGPDPTPVPVVGFVFHARFYGR